MSATMFGPDVQDLIDDVQGQSLDEYTQYDNVNCDGCGNEIEGGCTRLESGHIVHDDCVDLIDERYT